tara:strand:- start:1890 stop:2414 length:525 start_codon:yes stop_codon:yes gene_type:complete
MEKNWVALSGPRGCGKSTIAQQLVEHHGFERFAFSDILREIAKLAGAQFVNNRVYLLQMGEVLRKYQPDFMIKVMEYKLSKSTSNIVIEDIRFEAELEFCKLQKIRTIYLDLPREKQIKRILKRENCTLEEAENLIDSPDENHLNRNSGWDEIIYSSGDFRDLTKAIDKRNFGK